jgi:hypothetical protein
LKSRRKKNYLDLNNSTEIKLKKTKKLRFSKSLIMEDKIEKKNQLLKGKIKKIIKK